MWCLKICLILLVFKLHFSLQHSLGDKGLTNDTEIIELKPDNEVKFVETKPDDSTVREIVYYHIVEKPYKVEDKVKQKATNEAPDSYQAPDFDQSVRPFTNAQGLPFLNTKSESNEDTSKSDSTDKIGNSTESSEDISELRKRLQELVPKTKTKYQASQRSNDKPRRKKRDLNLGNIPQAPSLPPFSFSDLPGYIRSIYQEFPNILPGYQNNLLNNPVNKSPIYTNQANGHPNDFTKKAMSMFNNIPKVLGGNGKEPTYGMDLHGNQGYTWNNLQQPFVNENFGTPEMIGNPQPKFNNEAVKPKEIRNKSTIPRMHSENGRDLPYYTDTGVEIPPAPKILEPRYEEKERLPPTNAKLLYPKSVNAMKSPTNKEFPKTPHSYNPIPNAPLKSKLKPMNSDPNYNKRPVFVNKNKNHDDPFAKAFNGVPKINVLPSDHKTHDVPTHKTSVEANGNKLKDINKNTGSNKYYDKIKNSFQNLLNKISFFKPKSGITNLEPEPDNNEGKSHETTTENEQKSFNKINNLIQSLSPNTKQSPAIQGTYGMRLAGDTGYVWNDLDPNHKTFNDVGKTTREENQSTKEPSTNPTITHFENSAEAETTTSAKTTSNLFTNAPTKITTEEISTTKAPVTTMEPSQLTPADHSFTTNTVTDFRTKQTTKIPVSTSTVFYNKENEKTTERVKATDSENDSSMTINDKTTKVTPTTVVTEKVTITTVQTTRETENATPSNDKSSTYKHQDSTEGISSTTGNDKILTTTVEPSTQKEIISTTESHSRNLTSTEISLDLTTTTVKSTTKKHPELTTESIISTTETDLKEFTKSNVTTSKNPVFTNVSKDKDIDTTTLKNVDTTTVQVTEMTTAIPKINKGSTEKPKSYETVATTANPVKGNNTALTGSHKKPEDLNTTQVNKIDTKKQDKDKSLQSDLNKLLKKKVFWDWLSGWTTSYMEIFNNNINKLIKEEVAAQIKNMTQFKKSDDGDKIKSSNITNSTNKTDNIRLHEKNNSNKSTENPIKNKTDDQTIPDQPMKNNGNKTKEPSAGKNNETININGDTIHGNNVDVTNVFIFVNDNATNKLNLLNETLTKVSEIESSLNHSIDTPENKSSSSKNSNLPENTTNVSQSNNNETETTTEQQSTKKYPSPHNVTEGLNKITTNLPNISTETTTVVNKIGKETEKNKNEKITKNKDEIKDNSKKEENSPRLTTQKIDTMPTSSTTLASHTTISTPLNRLEPTTEPSSVDHAKFTQTSNISTTPKTHGSSKTISTSTEISSTTPSALKTTLSSQVNSSIAKPKDNSTEDNAKTLSPSTRNPVTSTSETFTANNSTESLATTTTSKSTMNNNNLSEVSTSTMTPTTVNNHNSTTEAAKSGNSTESPTKLQENTTVKSNPLNSTTTKTPMGINLGTATPSTENNHNSSNQPITSTTEATKVANSTETPTQKGNTTKQSKPQNITTTKSPMDHAINATPVTIAPKNTTPLNNNSTDHATKAPSKPTNGTAGKTIESQNRSNTGNKNSTAVNSIARTTEFNNATNLSTTESPKPNNTNSVQQTLVNNNSTNEVETTTIRNNSTTNSKTETTTSNSIINSSTTEKRNGISTTTPKSSSLEKSTLKNTISSPNVTSSKVISETTTATSTTKK